MHRLLNVLVSALLVLAVSASAATALNVTHVYGCFGGLCLASFTGSPPSPLRLDYSGVSRLLLYATLPDPLIQEKLSKMPIVVSALKLVEPVETSWYRLAWFEASTLKHLDADVSAGGSEAKGKPLMLVIVPDGLEWFGEELAKLHTELRVLVLNWSSIMRECVEPAPPPPGYVEPSVLAKKCGASYNLTKALCLIALERRLLKQGLRYLLLVGPASVTPPVYYHSPILEYVGIGRCQEYVPTDYWYADPLYEWKPVVAVGRLPFNDTYHLTLYLDYLREWMGWSRRGVVAAGGALFKTSLMLGETAVYSLSRVAHPEKVLTLSLGGYSPLALQGLVGRYALYYIVSHGIGDVLLDIFPEGLLNARTDLVLAPKELPLNPGKPGVYVTPACLSAYWDVDVIRPPFHPPSVGLALLEKGYAVAYYGSSRVAAAAIAKLEASPGRPLDVTYLGALRLTELVASMLVQEARVGDAVVKALAAYSSLARGVAIAYTPHGSEDVAEFTMLEFILLGDPAAPAPAATKGYTAPQLPEIRYNDTVPAVMLYPGAGQLVSGSLALIHPEPGKALVLNATVCPREVREVIVHRYGGLTLAGIDAVEVNIERVGGSCILVAPYRPGPALRYLILAYRDGTVARVPLVEAGLVAKPVEDGLRIWATGLDLLRVTEDEPIAVLVDSRIAQWIPGALDYYTATLAGYAGNVTVSLRPWRMYQWVAYGSEVAEQAARIYRNWFTVNVYVPYVHWSYTPRGVLVEIHGYRLDALEGASSVTRLGNNTLLVCAERPFKLVLVAPWGGKLEEIIPAAYSCNVTTSQQHGGSVESRGSKPGDVTAETRTAAIGEKGARQQTMEYTAGARTKPVYLVALGVSCIAACIAYAAVYATSARRRAAGR